MSFKPYLLVFISSGLLFTSLIITLTHSSFECAYKDKSGIQQCPLTKSDICHSSVFQLDLELDDEYFRIQCPWNFFTTFSNFIGVIAGLVFLALTVLQRFQRQFYTRKCALYLGASSLIVLFISLIAMASNISGGESECEIVQEKVASVDKPFDCTAGTYEFDVVLMILGLLALSIEAIFEYRQFKLKKQEVFGKEDQTQESDYQLRFFEDN